MTLWHKLEEKLVSFVVFEHIRAWYSHFMFEGVSHMLEIQKQHKTFIMPSVLTSRQKNNCLRFLINRIIVELLLKCIEWLRNIFCTCFVGKIYCLTRPWKCIHMRKYFPAWPRYWSASGEMSVRRGIWNEFFCRWKLALWRDLVEIIFPPRLNNFSHMNSPWMTDFLRNQWN